LRRRQELLIDTREGIATHRRAANSDVLSYHEALMNAMQRGRWLTLPASRRLVTDLLYFAQDIPSEPLTREFQVASLAEARSASNPRIGWAAVFMKAYALLSAEEPLLRQTYMRWPWPHIYEHPVVVARLTIAREHAEQDWLFFARFIAPQEMPLAELQSAIDQYKLTPVEEHPSLRKQAWFGNLPTVVRRIMWWYTLNVSGNRRSRRFGTFGMTTVSGMGAVIPWPNSIATTTLTFGPVDPSGRGTVSIIYDHRMYDASRVARYLARLEEILHGPIAHELRALAGGGETATSRR
jgi:hypothetical protein